MRRLFRFARRWLRLAKWTSLLQSRTIAKAFIENGGHSQLLNRDRSRIIVGDSELVISERNADLLFKEYHRLASLSKNQGARWVNQGVEGFVVEISGIKMAASTSEEIFIIDEVFSEKVYGLVSNGPAQVIDIGANIGTATLYFANHPWVNKVIGFEPIEPTYQKAKHNITLNPLIASKISLFNFGLAGSDREEIVTYSESWAGSVGMRITHPAVANAPDRRDERMRLRNASSALQELGLGMNDVKTFMKMDCEGAEYEIINNLSESGLLKCVSALMVEWHDVGSDPLIQVLLRNGFVVLEGRESTDKRTGLIYAMRAQDEHKLN